MANLHPPRAFPVLVLSFLCWTGSSRASQSEKGVQQGINLIPSTIRDLVLEATREVLGESERRIESLEQEIKELRGENAGQSRRLEQVERDNIKLRDTVTQLERRFHYWDVINRYQHTPRTCEDVRSFGFEESGEYLIDPDGSGIGDPAFKAQCDLSGPKAITIINHDTMNLTSVDQCGDAGCHVSEITYQATEKQMRALITLSEECSQPISYYCFVSPLIRNDENMAWWIGADGSTNYYWDGQHQPYEHTCACAKNGSCVDERYSCNCDAGAPQWMSDVGELSATSALPVVELRFGGLEFDGQEAQFQLSPLTCSGKKHRGPPGSCEDVLWAGHTESGYYVVDGEGGTNYRVVMCNLNLDMSDPGFQVPTEVRFAEFPVAFDFSRSSAYYASNSLVPYESANVNLGNAMTTSGTFTAPLSGLYFFSFFFNEPDNDHTLANVIIRARGTTVAQIYKDYAVESATSDYGTDGTGGSSVLLFLSANDWVDVVLLSGGIGARGDAHFTGHLIYPLP